MIAMHPFDRDTAEGILRGELEDIAKCQVMMGEDGYAAHRLHRSALRAAHVRWALSGDADALAADLAIAAEAGVIAFEGASFPGGQLVTHDLGDTGTATVPYLGDPSFGVAEVFIDTFYAAQLLRKSDWLDRLCGAPADRIVGGDYESPAFRTQLAVCLRALWRQGVAPEETLFAAMEATDPEGLDEDDIDEALCHTAPAVHLLNLIGTRDIMGFSEALTQYQSAHAEHYGLKRHQLDFRGMLALDQAALAAVAHDKDMVATLSSAYLPDALIQSADG